VRSAARWHEDRDGHFLCDLSRDAAFLVVMTTRGLSLSLLLSLAVFACDSGHPVTPTLESACEPETPCGYLSASWTLTLGSLTCAEARATLVELEVTAAGEEPKVARFDCAAGTGLTPRLELGPYTVRARLLADGDVLGTSEAQTLVIAEVEQVVAVAFHFDLVPDGRIRMDDACQTIAEAWCGRSVPCGDSCRVSETKSSCCRGQECRRIAPLDPTLLPPCTRTISELPCALLTYETYRDVTDLTFCTRDSFPGLDPSHWGSLCGSDGSCPLGYACLSSTFSDDRHCAPSCVGDPDCGALYSGAGEPFCAQIQSGDSYCFILCEKPTDCPNQLTCAPNGLCMQG
jgi:hypothetical protein